MKKLVSIFLVVLLLLTSLFVLTGCNKGGDGNGDSGEAKIDKLDLNGYEMEVKDISLY